MHILPFYSIAEANENAVALQRAFDFYSVSGALDGTGAPVGLGLQKTRMLIANALGCTYWRDLIGALALGRRPIYLDSAGDLSATYQAIASRIACALGDESKVDKVRAALHFSAFGCAPTARKKARSLVRLMPCKTIEQWQRLQLLAAGYAYVSRYNHGRSAYDLAMLRWQYEHTVAEVLGTRPPPKPRRPKRRYAA